MTDKQSSTSVEFSSARVPVWQLRVAALSEATVVLLGGNLLAAKLSSSLGLARARELINSLPPDAVPDFMRMAWITSLDLAVKYGILFGLAFLIGWWHRRRPLQSYGLTLAGRPLGYHLSVGVVLFAVAGLLPAILLMMNNFVALGAGPAHWSIFSQEWTLDFWVFMAVSSFGLVPVFEELFIRGYFQTRLTEDFGAGGAILITAFMFALSHTQYFQLSVMSLGMLAGIILSSIFLGYVFYRTRSLVAVIVAHAIGNIPTSSLVETILPVVMLAVILLFRKHIVGQGMDMMRALKAVQSVWATVGGITAVGLIIMALFFARPLLVVWVVAGGLLTLIIEWRDRVENPALRRWDSFSAE